MKLRYGWWHIRACAASLSAELESTRSENTHLQILTNQQSISDDREGLRRKVAYLTDQNGKLITLSQRLFNTCFKLSKN